MDAGPTEHLTGSGRRSTRRLLATVVLTLLVASGCRYSIVGDSVTFDSREELEQRGAEVQAYGGVTIRQGRPTVRELARGGREKLVIALGRMDLSYGDPLGTIRFRLAATMRGDIRGIDCVIWVDMTTRANGLPDWPRRSRAFNAMLRELAAEHGVHVAAWSRLAAEHPGWFRNDRIHLRPIGQRAYADFVTRSVGRFC